MNDPVSIIRDRIGRRGLVLVTLGVVWVLYGLSIATYEPPSGTTGRFQIAPLDSSWWALVWLSCGTAAIAFAIRRRWGHGDVGGWVAGILPPLVWSVLYGISWLWALTTVDTIGSHRAWVGIVTWSLVGVLVRSIAGWEDYLHRSDTTEEPR